ncbi:helix-turn-helix domain-containing protein [Thermomonospora umbrina]|uniref:PucR-like helix-turn-helix protein n=1 Tax=Thermomonospora umbrina TaxID=111806 RepID=A0A3D9SLC6_9ACTN|nr:helix-turn-helix domain-containing protein [Thermomonospora umbrina]REE96736.1 PucR-like helix-turn-helix protein [Thermomonospora umbrina]
MTEHNDTPTAFGGVPVDRLLSRDTSHLTTSVLATLVAELPVYASLPAEQLRGDISRVVEQALRTFARMLRSGEPPTVAELETMRESAARRAEEGIPLDVVLSAYHLGTQKCLDRVNRHARPDDLPAVLTVQRMLLMYLRRVTAAVSAGYLQERQAAFGEEHYARQALLAALLDGVPAHDAAQRAGIVLPARYLVTSLAVGAHPDELAPGVDPLVASRRKLRRLRAELERQVPGTVLSMLTADGGLALIPLDGPADDAHADAPHGRELDRLSTVVEHLTAISGAAIVAGAVAAPADDVAAAARLATEVREVAQSSGRGPGVYRLADVVLEYQLTRPGPARDRLAGLLAPLDSRPDLFDTLRAFVACGLDRRATAARLHVHRNTVDYRLNKIADLIGLDPTRGADLPTLHAALAAHRSRRGVDPA